MKYYCPNCKSEITTRFDDNPKDCYICHADNSLVQIPEFETPSQYEKRTGNKWNGAVWWRFRDTKEWQCNRVFKPGSVKLQDGTKYVFVELLCAASPEPPPDDYVPEVDG